MNNKFIPSDFLPIGFLGYLPYSAVPAGWLVCDGTVYNVADYPELAAKLGSTYGGDGAATFAVPDDRGLFRRGLDLSKGYDSGRVLGSEQGDEFESHKHLSGSLASGQPGSGASLLVDYPGGSGNTVSSSTGGTETRPKNRAYFPIIKAKNIYYDMTIQGGNAASLGGNAASYYAANSQAVKYTDFTGTFATNGYRRLPDGTILQWGTITISGTGPSSVVFPLAHLYACRSVVATMGSGANYSIVEAVVGSTTHFNFYQSVNQSTLVYWQSIGY